MADAKPLDDGPLDVIADVPGSSTADIKVIKDVHPVADGKLHLAFATIQNDIPFVNAIKIAPSEPGSRPLLPQWRARAAKLRLAGADEPEVYHSERVGNFS